MTGVELATVIALMTVAGLLLWTAVVRAQTRITPTVVPDGMEMRDCGSACRGPVPHVVLPCGVALCATCGAENPAPYRS